PPREPLRVPRVLLHVEEVDDAVAESLGADAADRLVPVADADELGARLVVVLRRGGCRRCGRDALAAEASLEVRLARVLLRRGERVPVGIGQFHVLWAAALGHLRLPQP